MLPWKSMLVHWAKESASTIRDFTCTGMGLICLFRGERMKYFSYLLETRSIERTVLHFFVSWINAGFERTRWDQSECQPYH
jgi:hypothetical protein